MQQEVIDIRLEKDRPKRDAREINDAIASVEKSAEKMAQTADRTVVSIMDRSRQSTERLVSSIERRVIALKTPLERLRAEQQQALSRVAGDPGAVDKVNVAFTQLIANQKQIEVDKLLHRAQVASKEAARETDVFQASLGRVNREQREQKQHAYDQLLRRAQAASKEAARGADEFSRSLAKVNREQRQLRESTVSRVEGQALGTRSPVDQLMHRRRQDLLNVHGDPAAIKRVTAAYDELLRAEQKQLGILPQIGSALGKVGIGLSAIGAAKFVFKDLILDSTLYAARTEQLGIALDAVASANGVVGSTVDALEARMKKLGITTQETRSTLARLIATGVDIKKAEQLARTAQDLGRVSGVPSSEALERLTHAIVTLQPELFRTLGLNVNLERSYQKAAQQQNRNADSLTELERRQIALNEALRQGEAYAGVYANSMATAGGQVLSFDRYIQEAKNSLGNEFLPLLQTATGLLTSLGKEGDNAGSMVGRGIRTAISMMNPILLYKEAEKRVEEFVRDRRAPLTAARKFGSMQDAGQALLVQSQREGEAMNERIDAERKKAAEEAKKLAEDRAQTIERLNQRSISLFRDAVESELTGIAKIHAEFRSLRREIGDDAVKAKLSPSDPRLAQSLARVDAAEGIRVAQEIERQKANVQELLQSAGPRLAASVDEENARALNASLDLNTAKMREQMAMESDLSEQRLRNARDRVGLQEGILDAQREKELRALEAINAVTVDQKIDVEKRKAKIEEDAFNRSMELKLKLLAADQAIDEARAASAEERALIGDRYDIARSQLAIAKEAEISKIRETAAIRSGEILVSENQKALDTLQRQAEGVFDSLVRSWRQGWSGAASFFQTLMLTAIKNVATSLTVNVLGRMQGLQVQGAPAGGGFSLAGLLGLGLGGGMPSSGGSIFGGGSLLGPGGTGGFSGPVSLGGSGGQALGPVATLKAYGSNFLGILSGLGGIGHNAGRAATGAAGSPLNLPGVGGVAGGAMLLGGGILAMNGVRQGGWGGLAQTTAGGALIGAKFGGPVGGLIGGAIGFGVGLIGLFRKAAEQKIVEAVQKRYGIKIDKSFARNPLLPIIKDQFGGDVGVGIASPQIQELIRLYAMSRGQSQGSLTQPLRPSVFANQNGVLTAVPQMVNGSGSFGQLSPAAVFGSAAQSTSIVLALDGPTTQAVLQGQAIEAMAGNPRAVADASARGQKEGVARRSSGVMTLRPNFRTT